MKKTTLVLIGILTVLSCSSTRFVDSWRNKEVTLFQPRKLLVIGMTDNLTARKIFEEALKNSFISHGIEAHESSLAIDASFTANKKSEEEIEALKEKLLASGYDAAIITAVVGVDDKSRYGSGQYTVGYHWYRFGRYYYRFQNIYYTPEYYEAYKVYHIETSIYNLREAEDRSLVWVGTFDIVDPDRITATVRDYVDRIIKELEGEGLIMKLSKS
jgi:hypothetical protein